jgi:hypothetical protein
MSVRLVIDALIALLLASLLALLFRHHSEVAALQRDDQAVQTILIRLYDQVLVRAALEDVPKTEAGFPLTVPPEWFDNGLPKNPLLPAEQPWLDIANEDYNRDHPPDPVILGPDQPGFWYNPHRGTFRARVIPQFTDGLTLELYNRINSTALETWPQRATDPNHSVTVRTPADVEPANSTAAPPQQQSDSPRAVEPAVAGSTNTKSKEPEIDRRQRRPSLKDRSRAPAGDG